MGILNQSEVDDIEVKARLVVEGFFQSTIFAEFAQQIKAEEYEHAAERVDVRSGTYPRIFTTTFGRARLLIPKAVKCFQDEFYHTLNFYDFPKGIRSAVSAANHLERFLEEIRRRIKIQGYFKNERSLNLWIFGLIKHINLNPIQQPEGYVLEQKCEIILA